MLENITFEAKEYTVENRKIWKVLCLFSSIPVVGASYTSKAIRVYHENLGRLPKKTLRLILSKADVFIKKRVHSSS